MCAQIISNAPVIRLGILMINTIVLLGLLAKMTIIGGLASWVVFFGLTDFHANHSIKKLLQISLRHLSPKDLNDAMMENLKMDLRRLLSMLIILMCQNTLRAHFRMVRGVASWETMRTSNMKLLKC